MPGTTRAVTAKKPENNKYKDEISSTSLAGIKYKRLQIKIEIKIPKKNCLDILGLNGSIKAEQKSKEDRNDLKAKGCTCIKNKITEERE